MKTKHVHILDYGMGNLGSIMNIIRFCGGSFDVCAEPEQIQEARKIILPGVGRFGIAMERLQQRGWIDALSERRNDGCHILGICLGMQLMTEWSDEDHCHGIGWFPLKTIGFKSALSAQTGIRVPHMGWNEIRPRMENGFWDLADQEIRFYFIHSYFVDGADSPHCLCETEYCGITFASGIRMDNVLGLQFHPEKSHRFGMSFVRNFLDI